MRDYATQQRQPGKHLMGWAAVVVLHALVLWLMQSGWGQKIVRVVHSPVQAQLLMDSPPPAPVPPVLPTPTPPVKPLHEPVPPLQAPLSSVAGANAVTAAPAPPSAPAAPAPSVRSTPVLNASVNCAKPDYPLASRRNEEEGTVQLRFLIGVNGQVVEAQVEKSSGYSRLDEAARQALSRCQFKPGTLNGVPEQSWASLKYVWRLEN